MIAPEPQRYEETHAAASGLLGLATLLAPSDFDAWVNSPDCYSMRRRYRAQAVKPQRSAIDCKMEAHMKFMVSWTVPQGTFNAAVARFLETGGAPPEGVKMLGRWHSLSGHGFAISEASDPKAMYRWVTQWADLLPLTVSPCLEDADAGEVMASLLRR